jgi:hypothetical protein
MRRLTPFMALVAGVARGTRERGKPAGTVVPDADPLADIANIRRISAVFPGGRAIRPA